MNILNHTLGDARTDLTNIGRLKGLEGNALNQWVEGMLNQGAVQSEAKIENGIPVDNRDMRPIETRPAFPTKEC